VRKIADTVEGNVLIEMTVAEWERLRSLPQATTHEITLDSLERWREKFIDGLSKLPLTKRTKNAIHFVTQIKTVRYEKRNGKYVDIETPPYIWGWVSFSRLGPRQVGWEPDDRYSPDQCMPMPFDNWCEWVLSDPPDFFVRNIGPKGKAELIKAIKEYRAINNDPT